MEREQEGRHEAGRREIPHFLCARVEEEDSQQGERQKRDLVAEERD